MKKARIRVPSLQHLARVWDPDASRIQKTLVNLSLNGPTFSYQLIYELIEDLIHYKIPYDQVERAVQSRVHRENVRSNFLELLPLINSQLSGIDASFVHRVSPRQYPIAKHLTVPFSPPFIYGEAGVIHMPWFSLWKANPLSGKRLKLFVTIVDEILAQDPDLDEAVFSILDFSAKEAGGEREVRVLHSDDIGRLTRDELVSMLSVFVEGYEAACAELQLHEGEKRHKGLDKVLDVDQLDLFQR